MSTTYIGPNRCSRCRGQDPNCNVCHDPKPVDYAKVRDGLRKIRERNERLDKLNINVTPYGPSYTR